MKLIKKILIFISLITVIYIVTYYIFNTSTVFSTTILSKQYKESVNSYFEDENFYKCIVDSYNRENGTYIGYSTILTDEELRKIKRLYCDVNKTEDEKIVSTQGIEKLTSLNYIYIGFNLISDIDISKNTQLSYLNVSNNQLTELDVSKNLGLTSLSVENNQLTELDVSKNIALTSLEVSENQLTELDVRNNVNLTQIYADNNQLKEFVTEGLTSLHTLSLHDNLLKELDLSNNTSLEWGQPWLYHNPFSITLYRYKNTAIEAEFPVKYPSHITTTIFNNIVWNSNNLDIAFIDEKGTINTVNPGTVIIDGLTKQYKWGEMHDVPLTLTLNVVEITSDKYFVDGTNEYIYVEDDSVETVKDNINISDKNITIDVNFEEDVLYVKHKEKIIKQFTIRHSKKVDTGFEDDNLYNCILKQYNKQTNENLQYPTVLSSEQLSKIKQLECFGHNQKENKKISSTKGIEKLTSLTNLKLNYQSFEQIDIRNNIALEKLELISNQLTSIDITNNTLLKEIYLIDNKITNLDIKNNQKLLLLNANSNNLNNIEISKNPSLEQVYLEDNKITNIDVSKNINLKTLDLEKNELVDIDVSKNINLETLSVSNNKITNIDISKNVFLKNLYVGKLGLTKLDISKNTMLLSLSAYSNKLKTIDLSQNKLIQHIFLEKNELTELDISKNINLKTLSITDNQLTELDVSKNLELIKLDIGYWYRTHDSGGSAGGKGNLITRLNLNNNTKLKELYLTNNKLTELNISDLAALNVIYINNNPYGETRYVYEGKNILVKNQVIVPTHLNWDNPTWTSEDSNLATVDSSGLVTGVKSGTVNITGIVSGKYTTKSIVNVVEITSDKYVINENDDNIYIGTEKNIDNIKNNITVSHTGIAIKPNNNNLQVKYNEDILKEFKFISINFGKFNEFNKLISVSNKVSYDEFIGNITKSDEITYEIYNGTEIVTSGNISEGMKLKVYYKEQEIDVFDITNEYLIFSKNIKVDENKKYLSNISLGTNVDYLLKNIDTTGEIIVTNGEGKEIVGDNILSTGSIVTIKLSKETHQYTVIVRGDTTGDGKVNVTDVSKLYQALRKKIQIEDYFKEAGNVVSTDNEIKITDVTKLYQFARKKISSLED